MIRFRSYFGAHRTFAWLSVTLGALAATACALLAAQQQSNPMASFREGRLEVVPVQNGVYLIAGAGGNVVVQTGEETTLLIDSGSAEFSEQIRTIVRRISKRPIGFILNTKIGRAHV